MTQREKVVQMVNVARSTSLIVGGLVVVLLFMVFAPLFVGFWGAVDTGNFSSADKNSYKR